jgi:hypothetical protein
LQVAKGWGNAVRKFQQLRHGALSSRRLNKDLEGCVRYLRFSVDPGPSSYRPFLTENRQGNRTRRADPVLRRGHVIADRRCSSEHFKELQIAGSNAFGMEDFEGRRRHAIVHYLQLVSDGRLDITPMLTHRFGLEEWWPALKALARQGRSGALKVAFTPNG